MKAHVLGNKLAGGRRILFSFLEIAERNLGLILTKLTYHLYMILIGTYEFTRICIKSRLIEDQTLNEEIYAESLANHA